MMNSDDEKRRPLIFILGFMNSQPKHFETLKRFYENFCEEVIVHIGEMYNEYVWPSGSEGYEFIKEIYLPKVAEYKDHPVIIHSFSQNGGRLFYYLWRSLNYEQRSQVKGIIGDAGPCELSSIPSYYFNQRFSSWPRKDKTTRNFWLKCVPQNLVNAAITCPLIFFGLFGHYTPELRKYDLPEKQLYLCSKSDNVVRFKNFRDYAIEQLDKGKTVKLKTWEQGGHCMQFREHPEEYFEECEKFVRECLANDDFWRKRAKL
ncbi:unnamed protein product [Bursaphelenchus xylophilus]|uniref:(pine wood nematode) hypothetical protein n=1 Tax=Bursaphelenchus xylophilus TaxID=6326 RepID=A0A1I7SF31_BURXY|nr:unnamed protein product [Bursaphelenchus xylophilus]CAG9078920.1 unnamed protein product [Bursaphelenchus xylophilus]